MHFRLQDPGLDHSDEPTKACRTANPMLAISWSNLLMVFKVKPMGARKVGSLSHAESSLWAASR